MTLSPDERRLSLAIGRMSQIMIALAIAGSLVLLVWRGWTWSAGWLLGCFGSALNFHWLRRVTEALGAAAAPDRRAVLLGLRYLLLGGGAYVILKYTTISLPATLAGLFISTAAVILEILIELMYARN
jgi:hypothetical protein